jgi:CheY-like chemotaxis protein
MQFNRVLVLDDDPTTIATLAGNLESLGDQYIVESAGSGARALEKVQRNRYALVIADLDIPEMDAWQLIKRIRVISPQTQLILLVGHPTPALEARIKEHEVSRSITKPFSAKDLLNAAFEALQALEMPKRNLLAYSDACMDSIETALMDLRKQTGARYIMLADAMGLMIASDCDSGSIDMATVLALVAGGFATAAEISRCLGDENTKNLNFHDGSDWEIYSASLSNEICMILLFDKKTQSGRIGMVWLCAKQTMQTLTELINQDVELQPESRMSEQFKSTMKAEIDTLFSEIEEKQPEAASNAFTNVDESTTKYSVEAKTEPAKRRYEAPKTIPIKEAQALGIIPEDLFVKKPQAPPQEVEEQPGTHSE